MKSLSIMSICVAVALVTAGCGGDGGCGCDLPRQTNDWFVEITFGQVPDEITAYPIFVDVTVSFTHLETGRKPPDGMMVGLALEPGTFDNGLSEIDQPLVNGLVGAVLQIDHPAVYTLTVTVPGESRTIRSTLTVGL